MFEPCDSPRVFYLPPGADFPEGLVRGLMARTGGDAAALGQCQLIVNTKRMARRVRAIFDAGPALLPPRLSMVTHLGHFAPDAGLAPAASSLRRRLELVQLISRLLDADPTLAPRASLFDLADSLAALIDEMQGEGVAPEALEGLDVGDMSGHWQRSLNFLTIARHFLDAADEAPDAEARHRRMVETIVARWRETPPDAPIILAGSTGSRGTTQLLMQAVAQLPQGAVILPGFDDAMPASVWPALDDPLTAEDHPQFRFHALLRGLGMAADQAVPWHDLGAPNPARNRLVSLALRPAPVTDQWLAEGPHLTDIDVATQTVTLLEAPSPRDEALAIALRLREAAETGQVAALITPDRLLTRQVSAALDRWRILPDDSAGTPLQLSPPGRFLRHVAGLFSHRLTAEALLTLLKHPLTHSGAGRGTHLLLTRELELFIRRKGMVYPDAPALAAWIEDRKEPAAPAWGTWLISAFIDRESPGDIALGARLDAHLALGETIARGSVDPDGSGGLWEKAAGRQSRQTVDDLIAAADAGGPLGAMDYADLFGAVLTRGEDVRDRDSPHPKILIWGTLEARVQGADLLILAGLNEGSWPEPPAPDPWLNRKMRHDAGLLLPERRIGLAAHDFQQAVAAPEAWLSRAVRSDEAETVPSRWVNRLTNLLNGLPGEAGKTALDDMRARGRVWLDRARALEDPGVAAPAPRPSPRPPKKALPTRLSVTEIKRLRRDPYAIYARHVLRLRPLDPLMRFPDALLRGIVAHEVLERFVRASSDDPARLSEADLLDISAQSLRDNVPWPSARVMWQARMARVAPWFVDTEKTRRRLATPIAHERRGRMDFPELGFTLSGVADRIDRTGDGRLLIYDYKTGKPPGKDEQIHFDRQLLLEAMIAENGGFEGIDPAPVLGAVYVGIGLNPVEQPAPLDELPVAQVREQLVGLLRHYLGEGQGFTARRAMHSDADIGDYDQLARFGEWSATDRARTEDLTP